MAFQYHITTTLQHNYHSIIAPRTRTEQGPSASNFPRLLETRTLRVQWRIVLSMCYRPTLPAIHEPSTMCSHRCLTSLGKSGNMAVIDALQSFQPTLDQWIHSTEFMCCVTVPWVCAQVLVPYGNQFLEYRKDMRWWHHHTYCGAEASDRLRSLIEGAALLPWRVPFSKTCPILSSIRNKGVCPGTFLLPRGLLVPVIAQSIAPYYLAWLLFTSSPAVKSRFCTPLWPIA